MTLYRETSSLIHSSLVCGVFLCMLRPCYTRHFFVATCNATKVALQVAREVELSSTFATLRDKLLAYNISSATCNVFQSSSLRCKLQGKLPRVTWPLISNVHKSIIIIIVMNSLDTRFSRNIFEAVQKTRSACFIGYETTRLRLVVLNPIKYCCLFFKHYLGICHKL